MAADRARRAYFMAAGIDWESMQYARNCGHFHPDSNDALDCISKERPSIIAVHVLGLALDVDGERLRELYRERDITSSDILPPGIRREDLPP